MIDINKLEPRTILRLNSTGSLYKIINIGRQDNTTIFLGLQGIKTGMIFRRLKYHAETINDIFTPHVIDKIEALT